MGTSWYKPWTKSLLSNRWVGSCSGLESVCPWKRESRGGSDPHQCVQERQVISKIKILNGKKENQTKEKLDFSLHIYNIQILNALFQGWLQSLGLERWWTLIPDQLLRSDSEVYQNGTGNALLHRAQARISIVWREKRGKAMKDGGEEERGKRKWPAVFFHPAWCSQKFSAWASP